MAHSIFVYSRVATTYHDPWSFKIRVEYDWNKLKTYKEWCKAEVGPNMWNYFGPYKKVPCEFRFKRGEDALAFKFKFLM